MPNTTNPTSMPSPYVTTEHVRTAIALAYSNFHNPRGLEKMWNSPWNQTLSGLVAQYNGQFTVHAEYPMFLPSVVVKNLKLRQEFADHNLDYHDQTSRGDFFFAYDIEPEEDDILDELLTERDATVVADTDSDGNRPIRTSARVLDAQLKAEKTRVLKRKASVKDLWKRRDELVWEEFSKVELNNAGSRTLVLPIDFFGDNAQDFDEELSRDSIASVADGGALNWVPDNVVNHVATIKLPDVDVNSPQEHQDHYIHRAGRKVYHYCTAIINELKVSPPRNTSLSQFNTNVYNRIDLARFQLRDYCAAYFECHRRAKDVIVVAGAGPFWQWAHIRREDVPEWDWLFNEVKNPKVQVGNIDLDAEWRGHFEKNGPFNTLGTESSDEQLNKINKLYLYPMTTDGHTPAEPNFSYKP